MTIQRNKELNLLKTAYGQIAGIIEMMENDRYCIDISKQILAVQGLLKKTNLEVLRKHLNHCVADAFEHGTEQAKQEKIDEILVILDRYYR